MTWCLDAFTSSASSPVAHDSTFPQLVTDTELESESSHAMDPGQNSAFVYELDMIVSNNVDTPVKELESALFNGKGLGISNSILFGTNTQLRR